MFTCVFRNRPKSARAYRYAERKLKPLVEQFIRKPFQLHITVEPEGNQQVAHLRLVSDKMYSVALSATGGGTYEALDNMSHKLKEFMRRRKERTRRPNVDLDKFLQARLGREDLIRQWDLEDSVDAHDLLKYEEQRQRVFAQGAAVAL